VLVWRAQAAERERAIAEGVGGLDHPPERTVPVAIAIACWDWMGGWQPQRLGQFFRLHGEPPDMNLHLALLEAIRDH